MKKMINQVDQVVEEMLEGMCLAHPEHLKRLEGTTVVIRTKAKKDKVVLISGGGSGHEPSHGGFVGVGMLDAAVAGEVFTSPTPDQVYEAIKATECGKGALLVIKNYTGDVMNFEMAGEMAGDEGVKVAQVIVDDDVAVENSTWTTGRRGIAGTIFIHKIAGAKAEEGAELEEVQRVAKKVVDNLRSMGMALKPCTVPAAGKPSFELAEDEVEIGLGIHGEPGTHREKIKSADETARHLLDSIYKEGIYKEGDEVCVLVNGLGATPLMELYIINKTVKKYMDEKGLKVYKTIVGDYMTSLEMSGFSISLLRLDDELKKLLDAHADTPAYKA